jgi:hypothetical protein
MTRRSYGILTADTIPMNDRVTCTQSSVETLIEVNMRANKPQMLRDEYFWDAKILGAEYKPASLNHFIKTCASNGVRRRPLPLVHSK